MPTKWKQGEHIVIIGDTGSGKTYLESKILQLRKHVIVLRTKPDDIKFDNFHILRDLKRIGLMSFDDGGKKISKFLLTPKYEEQQRQAVEVFNKVWKEGGWCIAIDETYYVTNILKLERSINKLLTQGRSKHISVVAGMQRPAWISRFAMSQATHAFIFRSEGRDIKSLADALSPRIIQPVTELTGYDFIYFHRPTKTIQIGNANKLGEIFG